MSVGWTLRSFPIARRQHLRGFHRGTENQTPHAFRFGSVSKRRGRRADVSSPI